MTNETWEIVDASLTETGRVSVYYHLKYASLKFACSNICQKLDLLLAEMFAGEDLSGKIGRQELYIYFVTQLSGSKAQLRLVVGKKEEIHSSEGKIGHCKSEEQPGGVRACLVYYDVWRVDTKTIATRLGCERMAFVDSAGMPTKKPVFVIGKEDDKITITAPIKGITNEEFDAHFKAKSKKPPAA